MCSARTTRVTIPDVKPSPAVLPSPPPWPRYLARESLRAVLRPLLSSAYRVTASHADRIPAEGGALLLPNHLSYLDPLVLSLASPRPIRFVMLQEWVDKKGVGPLAELFDSIAIVPTNAKQALRAIGESLEEGHLVGFFPEGQLSRTGAPTEPLRGFEMIARRSRVPVLPVWMDRLWDSMWSFHGHRFLGKKPHALAPSVRVGFGRDLNAVGPLGVAAEPSRKGLWAGWRALSVEALKERLRSGCCQTLRRRVRRLAPTGHGAQAALEGMEEERFQKLAANAYQLSEVDFMTRRSRVLLEWNAGREECLILLTLTALLRVDLHLIPAGSTDGDLAAAIQRHRPETAILLDASKRVQPPVVSGTTLKSLESMDRARLPETQPKVYPQALANGRVIAFTVPHPEIDGAELRHQAGWRPGSIGRLLPGFETLGGETLAVRGPSLGNHSLLIQSAQLDSEGFVMVR